MLAETRSAEQAPGGLLDKISSPRMQVSSIKTRDTGKCFEIWHDQATFAYHYGGRTAQPPERSIDVNGCDSGRFGELGLSHGKITNARLSRPTLPEEKFAQEVGDTLQRVAASKACQPLIPDRQPDDLAPRYYAAQVGNLFK